MPGSKQPIVVGDVAVDLPLYDALFALEDEIRDRFRTPNYAPSVVRSPAYRCFRATDIDVLVLGRHVLHKGEQTTALAESERQAHLAKFALD